CRPLGISDRHLVPVIRRVLVRLRADDGHPHRAATGWPASPVVARPCADREGAVLDLAADLILLRGCLDSRRSGIPAAKGEDGNQYGDTTVEHGLGSARYGKTPGIR